MDSLSLKQLLDKASALNSAFTLQYYPSYRSIRFSNSSNPRRYFELNLGAIRQTLIDSLAHQSLLGSITKYSEKKMRDLWSSILTDPAVHTLCTVQTLPLFSVLNKLIYVTNDKTHEFDEKIPDYSVQSLQNAIAILDELLPNDDDDEPYEAPQAKSDVIREFVGENVIVYGAPGTGKSFTVDGLVHGYNSLRTVFHPDTQYSDFVGGLRPQMIGDKVAYGFRPGPFAKALATAMKFQEQPFYLVIEEINRASAAAVFGEIFQLLDRKEDGSSRYSIAVNDPDLVEYLEKQTANSLVDGRIRIPANLSLIATMNSSDQAVLPMDAAFKRRWKFRYQALKFDKSHQAPIVLSLGEETITVEWPALAQAINNILANNQIPEDRLLGPWFLSESELAPSCASGSISDKLFMYLWDDVLRHGRTSLIFDSSIRNYGELVSKFLDGKPVFSNELTSALKLNSLPYFADAIEDGASPDIE